METWLKRALLVATCALLLWLLLRRFVPAHPIGQALESLFLAGALACATSAGMIVHAGLRRLLLGAAVALVIAAFAVL